MSEKADLLRAVRQWVERAENDLRNAEHTFTLDVNCPFDTICFHAQQCVEKYLKALLVLHRIDFPRIHDLRRLWQLASANVALGFRLEEILPVNRYTIDARYPGESDPIGRVEAEEALAIARKVREGVRKHLPPEILQG